MPFEFTPESYRDFSEQIINAGGDQATLTSVLADMQGTFTDQIALATKQAADVEAITAENERLKTSNMELFLRVGANQQQNNQQSQQQETETTMDTKSYMENYFKEDK